MYNTMGIREGSSDLDDQFHAHGNSNSAREILQSDEGATALSLEVEALIDFKSKVQDDLNVLQDWKVGDSRNADPCGWNGVECNSEHHVSGLNLVGKGLHGSISPMLDGLKFLRQLNLSYNSFSGTIPSALGNYTGLETLLLDNNQLAGRIPQQFGILKGLILLHLQSNSLEGSIPSELGQLGKLKSLLLHRNQFSGLIPVSLSNCSRLEAMRLWNNSLNGPIPPEFGNFTRLQFLDLALNSLTGTIPPSVFFLNQLRALPLQFNKLRGTIPDNASLPNVYRIELESNQLEGVIPEWLGSLGMLKKLDLSDNNLVGNIPASLGMCKNLTSLGLSRNKLTGGIPAGLFTNLTNLEAFLRLSNNELNGSIPVEIGQLIPIQEIDFSGNTFTGEIPISLGQCRRLQKLDLSANSLEGPIPDTLGRLSVLSNFDVSFNMLAGPIPENLYRFTNKSFQQNPDLCGQIVEKPCLIPVGAPSPSPTPMPSPPPTANSTSPIPSEKCKNFSCWMLSTKILLIVGVKFIASILCFLAVGVWWRYGRLQTDDWYLQRATRDVINKQHILWSEDEIKEATQNFSPGVILGRGTTSITYKGYFPKPWDEHFAVKIFRAAGGGEFEEEVNRSIKQWFEAVAILKHRHVVKLLGGCYTSDIKAVVMEYMPKGSLSSLLQPGCDLKWETRLVIATGVARALACMHHDCRQSIIHGNLSWSKVLLDSKFVAKITDFRNSTLRPAQTTVMLGSDPAVHSEISTVNSHNSGLTRTIRSTSRPRRTATEYVNTSTEGDVYRFGILLLELISGRTVTEEEASRYVKRKADETATNALFEILDRSLEREMGCEIGHSVRLQLQVVFKLAFMCIQEQSHTRPTMRNVEIVLETLTDGTSNDRSDQEISPSFPRAEIGESKSVRTPREIFSNSSSQISV